MSDRVTPETRTSVSVTPCTCTIACIPQGITDEQTCRQHLIEEEGLDLEEEDEWIWPW